MPLLQVAVEYIVDAVGADLELAVEVGIAHVALCVDEILDTGNHLAVVDISEVISLDEASEVDTDQVADGVYLCLCRGVVFEGFYGFLGVIAFYCGLCGVGGAGYESGTDCKSNEEFVCFHQFIKLYDR